MNDKDRLMAKELQYQSELGSKARVEHHPLSNDDYMEGLRDVLSAMALDLQETGKVPKELDYKGSFSVHVYAAAGLKGTFIAAGVNNFHKCHGLLASSAVTKLQQDVIEHYRGSRQKKRSGF